MSNKPNSSAKSRIAWRIGYLISALGIYLVDQSSKAWAVRRVRFQDVTVIRGVLDFVYAENPGIAFGQLQEHGAFGRWFFVVLAAIAAGVYFLWPRLRPRKRETVIGVPEVVMPSQAVQGQWRTVDNGGQAQIGDDRPMPLRLALPQPTKAAKTLSTEDQARLKVVMDFAQSLPLVEPDYTVNWLT